MLKPEEIRSMQVVDTFYPVIDGVVQTVHNYASLMNKVSYSCVLCPAAKGGFDDTQFDYDVIRSAALRFPFSDYTVAWPVNPSCIRKLNAGKPVDIVHFHSPFTQRDSAVSMAKSKNLPIVATFHTKYYDDIYQATKLKPIAKIVTDSVVHFYDTCDSVWACSETTAETLRSYGFKGDIFVMPNGTNIEEPENPEKLKEDAVKAIGIDESKKNLLFVGTQVWQKNLKLVLDTFRLLCLQYPNEYHLTIVGTGGDAHAIMSYAKKIGIPDDQLVFTGRISDRQLLSGVFLAADLFFFPSLYDNAPLVLREASILRTPALLVKGANSAEVINPNVNGFIAENDPGAMAAKIGQIFADEALLKQAAENARQTIPIPWDSLIPKVYDKYAEIIDKKKQGR